MLLKDIISAIEEIAPPECQADWDRSGLQVASLSDEAERIAVFLDPLPESVARALAAGCRFLLSHHPLSLKPDLPARLNNYFFTLKEIMRADACLYAAHTSLDVNTNGPASWLGSALHLENIQPLEKISCREGWGYGGIGELPGQEDFSVIVERIMKLARLEEASLCGPAPAGKIAKIAWCGGSGASLAQSARDLGAQLLVTGDVKYHTALEAPISVLDVGHHSLEEVMMKRFAALLAECLPGMEVLFIPSASPFSSVRLQGGLQ